MPGSPPPRSTLWTRGSEPTTVPGPAGLLPGAGGEPLPEPVRPDVPASGLRRSIALFKAFRTEETDPGTFYSVLARDSVAQLSRYVPLSGAVVLDVGGGPGYFADAFSAAGARYLAIDSDAGEMSLHGREPVPGSSIQGSGLAIPVKTGGVDVCYSSNVLEHVPDPWQMGDEMVRVTKPGGLVYLSFTTWLSPWGGHETAPWHYLGGDYAARRYADQHGQQPKNRYGESLFAVSVKDAIAWARRTGSVEIVDITPRYHPSWAKAVVHVPGLRELATWNLALVLRKR